VTPEAEEDSGGIETWLIAAIGGGIVGIGLLIVIICCCCRRNDKKEATVKPFPGEVDVELPKRDKKKKKNSSKKGAAAGADEAAGIDVGAMGSLTKKRGTAEKFHATDTSAMKAMQPTDDEKSG